MDFSYSVKAYVCSVTLKVQAQMEVCGWMYTFLKSSGFYLCHNFYEEDVNVTLGVLQIGSI